MENISSVLDMGEYSAYVWPSFAAAGLILLCLIVSTLRGLRRAEKALAQFEQQHSS